MSWANVKNPYQKPIGWWYYKILCEIGWSLRNVLKWNLYYWALNKMCSKYKINLYGNNI